MKGFVKAQKKTTRCTEAVVDYEKGVMELDWKPGQRFDYTAIKKATVRAADLTLKSVSLVARGTVATEGTNTVLIVSGTGERFILEDGGRGVVEKLLKSATPGAVVRVTGDIREDAKGRVAGLVVSEFALDRADAKPGPQKSKKS